ncbi:hypothetical protein ES708_26967 [subsurface metagenome]
MSYTADSLNRFSAKAVAGYRSTKKILQQLGKIKSRKLDKLILELHDEEFEKINCLECANCCKTISPAIFDSDVRRMASYLRMKTADFTDTYLLIDKEREYIFNQLPCPFLNHSNYCQIYKSRPKACREYPHTNRKRFYQILDLTARNSKICPAVFNIIGNLKKRLSDKNFN